MAKYIGEFSSYSGDNESNGQNSEEEYWRSCAMHLALSSVVPMVMKTVVDLGVLEIISKSGAEARGVSADEIASHLELTGDATVTTASAMLDRMLYLLAAHSILTCTLHDDDYQNRRLYALTPIANCFIPNCDGISLGPFMSAMNDKVLMDSWDELKSSVLVGGIPFNRDHRVNVFNYMGNDPRFNEVFNKAMINQTTMVVKEILRLYKGFDQLQQVVDVGGGLGVTLKLITSKYPHIKGINFDLPHVIQKAPHYPGVEHVAGDMFASVPGGDAIFMKWILHDWSDDQCLKLLKNCHKVLPENGKIIVVEGILPLVPDTDTTTKNIIHLDMFMLTHTGGKERQKHEFLSLATAAGFAGIRLECVVCNLWVMEFYK